MKTIYMP